MIREAIYYLENLTSRVFDQLIILAFLYVVVIIITAFKQRRLRATVNTEEKLGEIVQSISGQVDVHIRLLEFNLNILLTGPARLLLILPIVDAYNVSYDDSHPLLSNWRWQLESVLKIAQQQSGHRGTPIDCMDITRAIQANEKDYFAVLHPGKEGSH